MQNFEIAYARIIERIMGEGIRKQARNGETKSLFGESILIDNIDSVFPIVQGRKIFTKGVLGELAAMLRQPKHIKDFEKWGCNYWKNWAKEDGSINVDYGNAWFDFNGEDQIENLKLNLKYDPNNRRMIISGWRPDNLCELDLPCCHYSYQFHVAQGKLNMIWTQRSADMMIGIPSDIVFGAAWLIAIAREFGLKPGFIKMDLGDCHVYQEHYQQAYEYVYRVLKRPDLIQTYPTHKYTPEVGSDFCKFEPQFLIIGEYDTFPAMKLELKA